MIQIFMSTVKAGVYELSSCLFSGWRLCTEKKIVRGRGGEMAGTHSGIWYWITVGDMGKHFLLMVHLLEGRMKWHLLPFIAAFSICWKWFVFVTGLIKKKKKQQRKEKISNQQIKWTKIQQENPTERFSAIQYPVFHLIVSNFWSRNMYFRYAMYLGPWMHCRSLNHSNMLLFVFFAQIL